MKAALHSLKVINIINPPKKKYKKNLNLYTSINLFVYKFKCSPEFLLAKTNLKIEARNSMEL